MARLGGPTGIRTPDLLAASYPRCAASPLHPSVFGKTVGGKPRGDVQPSPTQQLHLQPSPQVVIGFKVGEEVTPSPGSVWTGQQSAERALCGIAHQESDQVVAERRRDVHRLQSSPHCHDRGGLPLSERLTLTGLGEACATVDGHGCRVLLIHVQSCLRRSVIMPPTEDRIEQLAAQSPGHGAPARPTSRRRGGCSDPPPTSRRLTCRPRHRCPRQ